MSESFEELPPPTGKRAVRPKSAATLVIVRKEGKETRILMGLRHGKHEFMPDVYVFPGGRVDMADHRVSPGADLRPGVEKKLAAHNPRMNPRALGMAVIRETFEETGLVVGRPARAQMRSRSEPWSAYFATGAEPALDRLDFIARAITPSVLPRRYDTRFFMADASAIHSDLHDTSGASGELLDLRWLTIQETADLELPGITRIILKEVAARLPLSAAEQAARPIPFYRVGQSRRGPEFI